MNGKILLHCCCAPCASGCIERLLNAGREVILFFSNSNIAPFEEYERRLEALKTLAKHFELPLIADEYGHEAWRKAVTGFENEPEKGARCPLCFGFSLARTAAKAAELGNICFATTLTVSPHKNSKVIFAVGSEYENFEPFDFKKQDGFKRSLELTGELGLYRQNYCGCEFSIR